MDSLLPAAFGAFHRLRVFLLLSLVGLLPHCRNPHRFGEELFPPTPTRVDTLYPQQVRQVFLPPPSTKNAPFVFIGQVEDTLVGQYQAGWATQFALGGQNIQFYAQGLVAVDSVVLELFLASAYGDFSAPLQVRVSRLTTPLSAAGSYDLNAAFTTDGQSLVLPGRDTLAFTTFLPGSYRFPLDTALGRFLLTLPPSALASEAAFQAAFPGLYVEAQPFIASSKGALYTVFPRSPSTALRIYYRERINGQEAPQRYDFYITDTCTWAYRLVRTPSAPPPLRDQLEQDSTLWRQRLLVAGGAPVGIAFTLTGWEKLTRRPVLSARLVWPGDSAFQAAYTPFYPRPNSLALYADTTAEAAEASWGLGEFFGDSAVFELSVPVQEIALARRLPPNILYLWPTGRTYTLQRWVAAGTASRRLPYLVVISAEP